MYKYTIRHVRWGMDRQVRPASIARGLRPQTMVEGLNCRSMPQRTCPIVFQTCYTAKPRRSTYSQLAPHNIRKSLTSMFIKHVVRLTSEHDFGVAQATLGPLKLTQLGSVDRWSFQT